jgi:hypothetical protein
MVLAISEPALEVHPSTEGTQLRPSEQRSLAGALVLRCWDTGFSGLRLVFAVSAALG